MSKIDAKPLRLEAITLRGLGSYLQGGRLEIRPLTLLCGTNGSGKSTWFRMLRILKQSLKEKRLPFALTDDVYCGESDFHDHLNAFVKFQPERLSQLNSPDKDLEFGRLGTIGLHLTIEDTFELDEVVAPLEPRDTVSSMIDLGAPVHAFLWGGRCERGTRLRIRITDTDTNLGPGPIPRQGELLFNHDSFIRFEETAERCRYLAICSRTLWPGGGADRRSEIEIGSFALSPDWSLAEFRDPSGEPAFDLIVQFCETAVGRIRQVLEVALRGIFWLSAIRQVQRSGYADEDVMKDEKITRERWVGPEGEYTHHLAARFFYNRVALPPGSGPGRVSYRYPAARAGFFDLLRHAPTKIGHPLALRVWDGLDQRMRGQLLDPGLSVFETPSLARDILNATVSRADLFDASLYLFLTAEGRALLDPKTGLPAEADLERINRILIDSLVGGCVDRHPGLIFDTYYSSWMRKLLGVLPLPLTGGVDSSAFYWSDPDHPPSGFLERVLPDDERAREFASEDELRNLNRYLSPLFGQPGLEAAPVNMSSGFHQIAPMVVQAGLMCANELTCIENPEVHLHPKLQLDLSEFLICQARVGKYMLVETHSDLVVRRVMRAILEEEIKQEAVRIHFTDVDETSPITRELRYASSGIQVLEIDQAGQIRNWPEGFLDADVRESRRLLDVMYGTPLDELRSEEGEKP